MERLTRRLRGVAGRTAGSDVVRVEPQVRAVGDVLDVVAVEMALIRIVPVRKLAQDDGSRW